MPDPETPLPADGREVDERNNPVDLDRWKAEFGSVSWSQLVPFHNWLTDRPWTLVWVQFISFAFGFPFLLMCYYLNRDTTLEEASWSFGVYFSVVWAALVHRCIRPEHLGLQRIVGTWLFTSMLGVVAVFIVRVIGSVLPVVRDVFAAPESASIFGRLIGMTLAVGLVEETAKLLPVLWFAHRFARPPRPTTIAYLGVVSGLAFGATEAIMYCAMYRAGHESAQFGYGTYLIVQLLRMISLPFLHAIWTGISAYFVGLATRTVAARRVLILTGLLGVSLLHGLYNTFISSGWLGFVIAMLSLGIFIGYVRDEGSALGAVAQGDTAACDDPKMQDAPEAEQYPSSSQ